MPTIRSIKLAIVQTSDMPIQDPLGKVEADLTLLKWMTGFNLALTVAIVLRLFAFHA